LFWLDFGRPSSFVQEYFLSSLLPPSSFFLLPLPHTFSFDSQISTFPMSPQILLLKSLFSVNTYDNMEQRKKVSSQNVGIHKRVSRSDSALIRENPYLQVRTLNSSCIVILFCCSSPYSLPFSSLLTLSLLPDAGISVAETLLLLLESLAEPVIPYSLHTQVLEVTQSAPETQKMVLTVVPKPHIQVFLYLVGFMKDLTALSPQLTPDRVGGFLFVLSFSPAILPLICTPFLCTSNDFCQRHNAKTKLSGPLQRSISVTSRLRSNSKEARVVDSFHPIPGLVLLNNGQEMKGIADFEGRKRRNERRAETKNKNRRKEEHGEKSGCFIHLSFLLSG
jgi:hypothetical protein